MHIYTGYEFFYKLASHHSEPEDSNGTQEKERNYSLKEGKKRIERTNYRQKCE